MRRRLLYLLLILVAAGAVAGVLVWRRRPLPGAAAKNTAAVQPELPNDITLQGKIRPQHVTGRVKWRS